jgi:hypothetical protein
MFTQAAIKTTNHHNATQASAWAMSVAMAMMPGIQTCRNQQTQRQSQDTCAKAPSFTQAENSPVFCFFYFYQPSPTHFTKRSNKIIKRLGEIVNHAHKGGARI